jgi:hypothetical protein
MKNKISAKDRAHLYLGLGLLSLGLLMGLFISLAYNINNSTLKAQLLAQDGGGGGVSPNGEQDGTGANSGDNMNAPGGGGGGGGGNQGQDGGQGLGQGEGGGRSQEGGRGGKNSGDIKPSNFPCSDLKEIISRLGDTPTDNGKKVKEKYDKYCKNVTDGEDRCGDLKNTINAAIESQETDTDEYANAKLDFTALCTDTTPVNERCKFLTEQMSKIEGDGQTSSVGYQYAKEEYMKTCQKDVPVAGFEDDVVTSGDTSKNPFSDTDLSTKEGLAAYELYRRGVIGGFADGTFKGSRPVNRAEAAKFLLLAKLGTFTDETGETNFKDIKAGEWYTRFVLKASLLGIIKGYEDGTFRPASSVTTAEFTKMLAVTFELETGLPYIYTDVTTTDWFSDYVGIAEKFSLFPEWPAGEFQPAQALTRKDVAIALYQYLLNR